MSYLDPKTWRSFTKDETLAYINKMGSSNGAKKTDRKRVRPSSNLVLQKTISPFDMYTYLHARFGPPNGFQTFLAKDDSDNLFHWDYNLKAGDKNLTFVGATEEVHVWFDSKITDENCTKFIEHLRMDFGRVGKQKGKFASTLEKWNVFPNQYLSIANRCAELYETITKALPVIESQILKDDFLCQNLSLENKRKSHGKLMSAITSAPTELAVLTPIMFESFVGLIVAGFIRPELKRDEGRFTEFVRLPLNQKLIGLVTVLRRSLISLCHLCFERQRADATQI